MIRSVLFDFDGTLADTRELLVSVYNEVAAKNGFKPVAKEDVAGLARLSIPERCRKLGVPLLKIPTYLSYGVRRFREQAGDIRLFSGIAELLEELQGLGVTLGIASSNDSDLIRNVLKREGLDRYFSTIAPSSSLFGKHKTLKSYMRAGGYGAGEVLYVGDELRDIEACQKVKVPVAAVLWGYDDESLLASQGPDLLVREPKEIAAWVLRSRGAGG